MNPHESLNGVRIGCVQYLNSRPLIHGLCDVRLEHPRVLAEALRTGQLDAALVPVFEWLRAPDDYVAVGDVGITSQGPVYSVFVAHERPLEKLRGVIADPASLTSIHLFQVLTQGAMQLNLPLLKRDPLYVPSPELGELWIGNQAIAHRLKHEDDGTQFWDLGEAWTNWTGLPFVYALWVLRRDLPNAPQVASAFRAVASDGVAHIPEIALEEREFGHELALKYLMRNIGFSVNEHALAGLLRFRAELVERGFIASSPLTLDFV
jgi:chorismate dehydratase